MEKLRKVLIFLTLIFFVTILGTVLAAINTNVSIIETGPTTPENVNANTLLETDKLIIINEPSIATGSVGLNENNDNAPTGLFGLTSNPLSIIALIGIVALIAIGAVIYTNKKK